MSGEIDVRIALMRIEQVRRLAEHTEKLGLAMARLSATCLEVARDLRKAFADDDEDDES